MLAWLQKGKRARSECETTEQRHDSVSNPPQPEPVLNEGRELLQQGKVAPTAANTDVINNNVSQDERPDCWSKEQMLYFCAQNDWLIVKDKKLGCKVCSKVTSLAAHKEHGLRLSTEWSECSISSFGTDKARQQHSLRKKIKEHKDSKSHIKAAEIEKMATRDEIHKRIQEMHRAEHDTTWKVFRTAYKIGKHGSPFTDMPIDVSLQELNGVNMGRVLHSNKTCADIIDHIATEMKKRMVDDIITNRRKLCLLIDESTTISGKTVLVVCLRVAFADAEPDTVVFGWDHSK
ncbi:hypothetical protein COCON_G00002630 [Conger conger]|uniref:DUF4371 domain-containing protein n=1 Tax=Conger conger TaxID=82655 RepID=A0A9Q1E1I9_CONCO|nr:hypothetical protein COCON_G00002630 [Conger conger]